MINEKIQRLMHSVSPDDPGIVELEKELERHGLLEGLRKRWGLPLSREHRIALKDAARDINMESPSSMGYTRTCDHAANTIQRVLRESTPEDHCQKHFIERTKDAFGTWRCPKCDPIFWGKCGMCGKSRLKCYC